MIEDVFSQAGLVPDIDDAQLGAAYESCPAVQKSVLKNAVSFSYALAQTGRETMSQTLRLAHVDQIVTSDPLNWAFLSVDLRRFPVTAVLSAAVLALVARVDTVIVHVTGPVSKSLLVGCDLLSLDQIFTQSPERILDVLVPVGPGAVVDLAGLDLDFPRIVRPDPADYGVVLDLPDSEYVRAYRVVTAETCPQKRPYIMYGGQSGAASVVMAERFLGCWVWDSITVDTFRNTTSTYI